MEAKQKKTPPGRLEKTKSSKGNGQFVPKE